MRIDFCHSVSLWCNHRPFWKPLCSPSLLLSSRASAIASATSPIVLPLVWLQSNHQIQSGGQNTKEKKNRNPTSLVVVASGGNVARSKLLTGNRLELLPGPLTVFVATNEANLRRITSLHSTSLQEELATNVACRRNGALIRSSISVASIKFTKCWITCKWKRRVENGKKEVGD